MSLPINPEYIHYIVDSGLAVLLWKGIRVANRILFVLRDFPPHRHVNGSIIYPDGYEPPAMEKLYGAKQ